MTPRTYTPVGDLPAGTRFKASMAYLASLSLSAPTFVVIRQVEDFTSVRRTDDPEGTPVRLLQCQTMVWPLSDFARSPTEPPETTLI